MQIPAGILLVLSGGNALDAYQAGAYEVIAERGLEPRRIVGTSIGAITGAIIAGNAPEDRIERLRSFWRSAEQPSGAAAWGPGSTWSNWEKWSGGVRTLLAGRPSLFVPHIFAALPWAARGRGAGLLDSSPTVESLCKLIDFDLLNAGRLRLTVLAVDAATGEEVVFDTSRDRIGPEHLLASASMPVLFDPVEIGGRRLVDGGMSANLPIRIALAEPPTEDTLCVALDLLPAKGDPPRSLGAAAVRAQDLIFSCQSRQAIGSLVREHHLRSENPTRGSSVPSTTLVHVIYDGGECETAVKALDFTRSSIQTRWSAGTADMVATLEQIATLDASSSGSFRVLRMEDARLKAVD